ncbi:hypothetical protein ACFWIB_11725 [Streptomyces sp. NPDC127051]|uniref:hypothetical protein n=1 Tax=Streptomyces sp. NPDC127051 TaxID=3347119 RepID=UPI003651B1EF
MSRVYRGAPRNPYVVASKPKGPSPASLIAAYYRQLIASGELEADSLFPTRGQVADVADCHVKAVSAAASLLRKEGLLRLAYVKGTSGRRHVVVGPASNLTAKNDKGV